MPSGVSVGDEPTSYALVVAGPAARALADQLAEAVGAAVIDLITAR